MIDDPAAKGRDAGSTTIAGHRVATRRVGPSFITITPGEILTCAGSACAESRNLVSSLNFTTGAPFADYPAKYSKHTIASSERSPNPRLWLFVVHLFAKFGIVDSTNLEGVTL
jgi:hypothetical protein